MMSREEYIFKEIFNNVDYYEAKGVIHIGFTTGKSCKWTAHFLCGKRPAKGWVGFGDLAYAKSSYFCRVCFLLHIIKKLGNLTGSKCEVEKHVSR